MAKYLVLYRSSVPAGEQMAGASPEQAQAGMELWMQWAGKVGPALVDLGSPVMPVKMLGKGIAGQSICGFSILEADSKEAVSELLDGHPHLQSPGDPSIETLEFMAIPGM
jgi:hypothetical protein